MSEVQHARDHLSFAETALGPSTPDEKDVAVGGAEALTGIGFALVAIHDQLRDLTFAVNSLAGRE